MAQKKVFKNNLTLNIIIATTTLLIVFGIIISAISYTKFNDTVYEFYHNESYATATSALDLFNADHIDDYLANADKITGKTTIGEDEQNIRDLKAEFDAAAARLQKFAETQNVAILYVIVPNQEDYSKYYSVFNCPNAKFVPYSAWELGSLHEHSQPNEYDGIYKNMMENGLESANVSRKQKDANGGLPHINMLLPVKDSNGDVVAIVVVQHTMALLNKLGTSFTILVAMTTLILAVVSVLGFILIVRKQFVTPIQNIVAEAQRFAKDNSEPDVPLDGSISKIHEISNLAEAIDQMELDTLRNIRNLAEAIKKQEKIDSELDIARQIQESLLPKTFPAFPNRCEFDLYASMHAAKQVGGDFYDYFLVDDDHLAFVMADVSGKGVPAALFMMATKIIIYERTMLGGSPAEILEFVNKRICAHNDAEMFVTVWLGILEISTGKITAANAGHDNPAVTRNGKFEFVKSKRGVVVGAMEDAKYQNFEIQLEKGDKIFLYTDGVPEATNAENAMFSLTETLNAINDLSTGHPKDIVEGVNKMIDVFVGGAPQFDDTTMLCIEYAGALDKNKREFSIPADKDHLPMLNDLLSDFMQAKKANQKTINQLLVCIEEIFVNVVDHADLPEGSQVDVSVSFADGLLTITFKDSGAKYNPLEKQDPDITLPANERREGGLGIFMTKKLVDNAKYEYVDGQNVLTLEKKL